MNSKLTRILVLAMVVLLVVGQAVPAMAATPESNTDSGKITINKNLIMKNNAPVPGATFSFTLASKTGTYAEPNYEGVMTGLATTYTATIASDSSTQTGEPAGTGEKFATGSFQIDFTSVDFTAPGIYHYTLTETTPGTPFSGPTPTSMDIDVYVVYADDDQLKINSVVVAGTLSADGTTATKTGSVNNNYTTNDLTLVKTVTGNQGNRNEHFEFTVTVTNPTDTVTGVTNVTYPSSYSVTKTCNDNEGQSDPTSITSGNATTFHLKDGETITINGLPAGATYTITETGTGTGYTTTYTVGATGPTTGSDTGSQVLNADTTVTFTNNRSGIIPTGVLLTIAPFVGLMLVGLVGVVIVLKKKKDN